MKADRIDRFRLGEIASQSSGEECVVMIGGDGKPYFSHLAFSVEDAAGNIVGTLALDPGCGLHIPLSRMIFKARPPHTHEKPN